MECTVRILMRVRGRDRYCPWKDPPTRRTEKAKEKHKCENGNSLPHIEHKPRAWLRTAPPTVLLRSSLESLVARVRRRPCGNHVRANPLLEEQIHQGDEQLPSMDFCKEFIGESCRLLTARERTMRDSFEARAINITTPKSLV